jgi:hypothetical protein
VVADTLSRRSHVSQLVVESISFELCEEFNKLNLRIVTNTYAMEMEVGSGLLEQIQKGQLEDKKKSHLAFWKIKKEYCGTKGGFVCLTSRN